MSYSTVAQVRTTCKVDSTDVADADVTIFIANVDAWIDDRTGKTYGTPSAQTDYFDVIENVYQRDWEDEGGKVTGSEPFFGSRNRFKLLKTPVTEITDVFLLERGADISCFYSYDADAGTYTDNTDEANSEREDTFYAFASSVGVGDIIYIGSQYKFLGVIFKLNTDGVGGVMTWEYYNGSSWTTVSNVAESVSTAQHLNASGTVSWDFPNDWEETTVNSNELFWIRGRVTTGHSTSPVAISSHYDPDKHIYKVIPRQDYEWWTDGRIMLRRDYSISESRRLKITYNAGASSVPTNVADLSMVLTSIRVLVALMGGSYDEPTSYEIGEYREGLGEPYTNQRAAIRELELVRDDLLKVIGRRVHLSVT